MNQASGGQPQQAAVDYNVSAYENYIYNAFLFPVNKAEALSYLDDGGSLPQRFAKVIAVRGANDPPDVMEYKVNAIFTLQTLTCPTNHKSKMSPRDHSAELLPDLTDITTSQKPKSMPHFAFEDYESLFKNFAWL